MKILPRVAVAFLYLGVAALNGQTINLISASRSVSVSDIAGSSNGSMTSADSNSSNLFGDFHGSVSGAAHWPDPLFPAFSNDASSMATQDSFINADGFTISQQISFSVRGSFAQGAANPAIASADALTTFQLVFTVPEAVAYSLTVMRFGIPGTPDQYSEAFTLSSASGTISFAALSAGPPYTGMLLPGQTYTFTASQHYAYAVPDPLGQSQNTNGSITMTFSSVPEPSELACLVLGAASIGGLKLFNRWRRARA